MTISVNILETPRVTVILASQKGREPIDTMREATRRFANQGARNITLVPNRSGDGWVRKEGG
jgi:hypothetical protein